VVVTGPVGKCGIPSRVVIQWTMSENVLESTQLTDAAATDEQRAVGFVASEEHSDALVREILRARSRGFEAFVVRIDGQNGESVRFAEQLGATVVDLRADEADPYAIRQRLTIAAEKAGCSNLLVNLDAAQRIDYNRSEQQLDGDQYCVDAVLVQTKPDPDETTPEVLVGIPAYNEASTIDSVVRDALAVADEVLVVDDGSDDETASLADAAGASVVEHDQNQGYGAALQTTFEEAHTREAEHLVVIDADGQHDPADIPRLVDTQEQTESEIVIGSRFADDGDTDAPLYRRFGLTIVNLLTNFSLGVVRPRSRVRDTQSGFRVYNQTAIESLAESDEIGDQMSASTDILYHAHDNDFDIKEVGTTITYDVEDASSHDPVQHGLTLVKNILFTIERQRPMTVLGVPGFISTFLGIGFAYWTLSNFLNSGTFPIGLALVSSVFVLGGIFACFTGIILHALNTQVVHQLEDSRA
jgi:glycosyltransferase involved in cell wall biosynthesis